MKFLTKKEIVAGLPSTKWDFEAEMNGPLYESQSASLEAAKYLYGPHMLPLNLATAKQCIGHTVYAIGGQTWNASTKKNKMKEIQHLKVHGFTDDGNFESHEYRKNYSAHDEIAISLSPERYSTFIFGVYNCDVGPYGVKAFGSGSGCDPIYIFAS